MASPGETSVRYNIHSMTKRSQAQRELNAQTRQKTKAANVSVRSKIGNGVVAFALEIIRSSVQ